MEASVNTEEVDLGIELDTAKFAGPSIEEFFDENPCLLEIGPISFTKLVYGDWIETVKKAEEMSPEEIIIYETVVAARNEVAENFMKFFNIKHKK